LSSLVTQVGATINTTPITRSAPPDQSGIKQSVEYSADLPVTVTLVIYAAHIDTHSPCSWYARVGIGIETGFQKITICMQLRGEDKHAEWNESTEQYHSRWLRQPNPGTHRTTPKPCYCLRDISCMDKRSILGTSLPKNMEKTRAQHITDAPCHRGHQCPYLQTISVSAIEMLWTKWEANL